MKNRSSAAVRSLLASLLVFAVPQLSPAMPAKGPPDGANSAEPSPAVPITTLANAALTAERRPARATPAAGRRLPSLRATDQEIPQLELSLLDAVEMALRYNLQVRVNRFNQDFSREGITSAQAPFDANISFQAPQTFTRSTTPQAQQTAGADILTQEVFSGGLSFSEQLDWGTQWNVNWFGSRRVDNNEFNFFNPILSSSLAFNVTQPMLRNFGRVNRTQIEVARNNYEVSLEQFRSQVQQIVFLTYSAYWQLVGGIENVDVQQQVLDRAQQQLNRNEIQVQIGTLAPIEMVQAQRSVANAEVALLQAQNSLEAAQDSLKQLLNVDDSVPRGWEVEIVPVDEPDSTTQPIDLEEAIATALQNDPLLRQLRINRDSDRRNLRFTRNQLLPRVNLNASLTLSGRGGDRIIRAGFGGEVSEIQEQSFADALAQVFSGDFNTWSVGVNVQFPLHNYSARANHARAMISQQQTLVQIAQQEQQVEVNVRNAVRNLTLGAQQVAAAVTARELSERQLEAEQRKFEVGTSTNFQVLIFQDQLAQAQVQELTAIISFNVFRAQLELAQGTLLESLGVSVRDAGMGRVR